ncbi:MAG TPA: hypothetical protein VFT74_08555, partial [Isosphaeraceae bacterium]|nr:hypothetical protein [Isosphaeraceae bacterium]
ATMSREIRGIMVLLIGLLAGAPVARAQPGERARAGDEAPVSSEVSLPDLGYETLLKLPMEKLESLSRVYQSQFDLAGRRSDELMAVSRACQAVARSGGRGRARVFGFESALGERVRKPCSQVVRTSASILSETYLLGSMFWLNEMMRLHASLTNIQRVIVEKVLNS